MRRRLPFALSLTLCCCDGSGEDGSVCGPTQAVVERVIDGDTVELQGGERVRYLMVDSPEVSGTPECWGPEAQEFNRATVEGKTVTLVYDEAECTDRFGRLLAFVSVGGREINALLVQRGFARVLYIPPSGADRKDEFEALEAAAAAGLVGLWGACSED